MRKTKAEFKTALTELGVKTTTRMTLGNLEQLYKDTLTETYRNPKVADMNSAGRTFFCDHLETEGCKCKYKKIGMWLGLAVISAVLILSLIR